MIATILDFCHWLILGLWILFFVVWVIAALFVRRHRDPETWRKSRIARVELAAPILIAGLLQRTSPLRAITAAVHSSEVMAITGAIVMVIGTAVAFWARAAIGRNWGSPGVRKTNTDLVTSGPYRFIRHPIYTGILLMMIGTGIGLVPTWLIVAAAAASWFIPSARAEEAHMTERFPEAYPAYKARTKMLVPFLY